MKNVINGIRPILKGGTILKLIAPRNIELGNAIDVKLKELDDHYKWGEAKRITTNDYFRFTASEINIELRTLKEFFRKLMFWEAVIDAEQYYALSPEEITLLCGKRTDAENETALLEAIKQTKTPPEQTEPTPQDHSGAWII